MKTVLRTILYPFTLCEIRYSFICSYPYIQIAINLNLSKYANKEWTLF